MKLEELATPFSQVHLQKVRNSNYLVINVGFYFNIGKAANSI